MKRDIKERRRLRPLDFCLFLLLAFSLICILLQWSAGASREESFSTHSVWLLASSIHPQVGDCLEVGDLLYRPSGEVFGRVTKKEVKEASAFPEPLRDVTQEKDVPGKGLKDLTLEVAIAGEWKQGILMQNGVNALLYGKSMLLYSDRTALTYWMLPQAASTG